VAGRRKKSPTNRQLGAFKLIEEFRDLLRPFEQGRVKAPRESDRRRKFDAEGYFTMMLFALLNPVIDSMRGLCETSRHKRFGHHLGLPPVSLASFSEAQSVFDPRILRGVIRSLLERTSADPPSSLRGKLCGRAIEAIDSTLWEVLPRMEWAHWRDQFSTRQNAVRLHLRWRLFTPGSGGAEVVAAKECERKVLGRSMLEPGVVYVGDRYYSGSFELLRHMDELGAGFVVRLQEKFVFDELEALPVSGEEKSRGMTHHVRVSLGWRTKLDLGWRVVRMVPPGRGEPILLLTNLAAGDLGAWDVCEIYRHRWSIELFFRWLKCTLPCRHWLAESAEGVTIQIYCSLIAALLLSARCGKLPTKRQMEAIRYRMMGWIDDGELSAALAPAKKRS
jgi:hypothetical protein